MDILTLPSSSLDKLNLVDDSSSAPRGSLPTAVDRGNEWTLKMTRQSLQYTK
jgi:hypothetical protein